MSDEAAGATKKLLSTTQCASKLSTLYEGSDAFDDEFIRGEIRDGLLVARVNYRGATRRRARIRVHPDDLQEYIARHHAEALKRATLRTAS